MSSGTKPVKVYAAELEGIEARIIEIEVDLHSGLHAVNIVGLADKALNEARERVSSALKNSGTKPPNQENRKITINLAPADIKKTGSQYDLGIALGYLLATGQVAPFDWQDKLFIGELALDGSLRSIRGALSIAECAAKNGFKELYLPKANSREAAAVTEISAIPISSMRELINHLEGRTIIDKAETEKNRIYTKISPDFEDVRGQGLVKRALEIAAAGRHNVLLSGSPGVGKSMLAQAFAGILPELTPHEAIEVTKVWSTAGLHPEGGLMHTRPFRSPHQTASLVSIVGGGPDPRPGEISLAHHGVLFLDELPEFQKNTLEALRQPMESGKVHVARARGTVTFPAQFTLVAAMNPCPCGFNGDPEHACRCGAYEVERYQKKISGPLLDRIDLQLQVNRIPINEIRSDKKEETSEEIRKRVSFARKIAETRSEKYGSRPKPNGELSSKEIDRLVNLSSDGEEFLKKITEKELSPRGFFKLLKVARTIADLEDSETTEERHLLEAYGYRVKQEH